MVFMKSNTVSTLTAVLLSVCLVDLKCFCSAASHSSANWPASFLPNVQQSGHFHEQQTRPFNQMISAVNSIPRGGGLFGFGKRRQLTLLEMLKDEKLSLEQKVRQLQESLASSRQSLTELNQASLSLKAQGGTRKQVHALQQQVKTLEKKVGQLEQSVRQLTEMKEQLEQMLETSQQKVMDLESKVSQAQADKSELQATYENQLLELKLKMEREAAKQLQTLRTTLEKELEIAVARAKEETTALLQAQFATELEQVEEGWKSRMEEESKNSLAAIELEKKKMRKLVKALAEREKKEMAEQLKSRKKTSKGTLATASKKKSSTETVRSPIK